MSDQRGDKNSENLLKLAEQWKGRADDAGRLSRAVLSDRSKPLDMLLFCPRCQMQHVDAPEPEKGWTNPPHATHTCKGCGLNWRPSNALTNGVAGLSSMEQKHVERFMAADPRLFSASDEGINAKRFCHSCQTLIDKAWCAPVSSIGTLEGLPNLRAIIDGRVSGHYTEWPMVRAELREMVTQWERALGDLNLALHAELLDTGLVTAEQWNEAIAPKLKACGQAIRMQDRIGQRSSPVSAMVPKNIENIVHMLDELEDKGNGWNSRLYPNHANDAETKFRDMLAANWTAIRRVIPVARSDDTTKEG